MRLPEAPVVGQRFFAPEVVQTSAMDCGPAALKSVLEGFSVPVSYGRLREACQTDVDGTSINTIEDIAVQLGLQAEQVMLPADHLILDEAQALPAIVVVQRPSGLTHFLVVWNRVGDWLQVMDPATGRRWPRWKRFQHELYIHTFPVPVQDWRAWAGSEGLLAPLRRRMADLQIPAEDASRLIDEALQDPGWRSLATLDAATRMTASLVQAKGLLAGSEAARVLERFYRLNLVGPLPEVESHARSSERGKSPESLLIPVAYWSALPVIETEAQAVGEEPPLRLLLRGAVLVRILGRIPAAAVASQQEVTDDTQAARLSPDLEAALKEPVQRPEAEVWKALRQDGLLTPSLLILSLFLATLGVLIEALLFQGMIRIGQNLTLVSQRILASLSLLAFVLALLLLEFPISATVLRMGRRLEARLRVAFLEKVPRLGDRYFRSRLTSDMTQRAHDLRALRMLPNLGVGLLRTGFQLILTMIGVIWLDPISAPLAILGTLFFVGLSFASRPLMEERDLRLRTHTGALSRFYLDSLLGLVPVRTHGAERAMRRQHEAQLYEWVRTGRDNLGLASVLQAVGALLYSAFSILIILNYLRKGGDVNEILLLFYWTLSLPALGQRLADMVQQYPMQRNLVLRLLEPLSAPNEEVAWTSQPVDSNSKEESPVEVETPVEIDIQDVTLQAGGHVILEGINLNIEPGAHLAIVGPSGAGKSSLVGLLLGWHRPSRGAILIDGQPLDGAGLQLLRQQTTWVDPAVQLWNSSLYDNLRYGMEQAEARPLSDVIQSAELYDVLEHLPDGLKTSLGEGGGLVSGGEGQRVRLGRAMFRSGVRLAILDEPFRGLDREKRRKLLEQARRHWDGITFLCITHDVGETLAFPRVLVIEDGRIVEDGNPAELAETPGSRYSSLLAAEQAVRRELWASAEWRRFNLDSGRLTETNGVDGVEDPG
jgi:ABC-type bacteriocin/lantibiotic exporter with double-glycine peptidase domain